MEELIKQATKEYIQDFTGICILSKKYGVPNKLIRESLEELGYNLGKGVSPKSAVKIKQAVDEYIEILKTDKEPNINTLAKKYGVSHSSISSTLKNKNIEIIKYPKIIQFNEHIFDNINSEEKAYWLGFLHADGYITTRDNTVGLCLAEKDLNHVEKYAKFLGCPENIHKKESNGFIAYRCDIGNKYLKNLLISKYNFTPTKSKDLIFPDLSIFEDLNLIYDYIRGYCDGDGSLSFGKKISIITDKITYYPILSFVGTFNILDGIKNHLGIEKNILKTKDEIYSLAYSHRKAKKVADLLYKNSTIYLDRKYEKYLDFCRHYKEL